MDHSQCEINPPGGTEGELYQFQVSQSIIGHLVERQAGSIEKAILETVTNGIDAKATRITIDFDGRGRVVIADNGHGFDSRASVEKHFAIFGFSHDSTEEQAREREIGRFGLGRGQLMSFAKTKWETNQFEMNVDIRQHGLVFRLVQQQRPTYSGCRITAELYRPMSRSAHRAAVDEIKRQVKYAPIEVLIDGRRMTVNPNQIKWTHTTEKLRFKSAARPHKGVEVYNLGIYVCTYPHHRIGASGVLLSRKGHTFDLNTARNDVLQSTCQLWQEAQELFNGESEQARKKGRLCDDDRVLILRKIVCGEETPDKHADTPLFKTVHGRYMSARDLAKHAKGVITVAESENSLIGERVHKAKIATVLAPEMAEWMNTDNAADLTTKLTEHFRVVELGAFGKYRTADYAEVSTRYSGVTQILAKNEWTATESAAIATLELMSRRLAARMEPKRRKRSVRLRTSGAAMAWTDGSTKIVFDRMYLGSQIGRNHAGWDALLATMVHEYCHGDPDMRDHLHGPDFYENFHATVTSASYKGWEMVDEAFRTYALEREKRKLSINEAMAEVLDRTDRSQSDHGGTSMPFGPGASPSSAQVNAKPVALATS